MKPETRDWKFPDSRILVFAKAPLPGRVKTRLYPLLSPAEAAALGRELIRRTLEQVTRERLCPVELWCDPDTAHPEFVALERDYPVTLHSQRGADLGQRMDHALKTALKRANAAILIGTDCVSLTPEDFHTALGALERDHELVLGPAEDGGYVLIGMKRVPPQFFAGMDWGTSAVLSETRRRIRASRLSCLELREQWDLDRPEDLRRYRDFEVDDDPDSGRQRHSTGESGSAIGRSNRESE